MTNPHRKKRCPGAVAVVPALRLLARDRICGWDDEPCDTIVKERAGSTRPTTAGRRLLGPAGACGKK